MISTDTLQTWLGLLKAFIVAAVGVGWASMDTPEGFNWKSPALWISMIYAGIEGIKGYYSAGVHAPPIAVVPTNVG